MMVDTSEATKADISRASALMGSVDPDKKLAMVLLIKQLMIQLNEIAYLKSKGLKADLSMYLFSEMCSVLKELEPDLVALYYDYVLKFMCDDSPPKNLKYSERYAQAAAGARQRFIDRMRTELAAKAA
ncbi:MAG: hypothetical protein KDD66_03210 [Bdellovibrionales bacterium]|nr:hypothetical protein [Bdellovibrionales bacterium]